VPGSPPRSGPNCTGGPGSCLTYPYTGPAAYLPDDFVWLIPAFLLGPLLVMLLASLLHDVPGPRRPFARIALALATASAALLMVDYYVQFTTVQTSYVRGETSDGLSLLTQYNPHGIFIALEDLGYATMLTALAVAAPALARATRPERVLRRVLGAAGTLGALLLPILLAILGHDLEYTYEVLAIVIAWTTLIVAGILAAIVLRADGAPHLPGPQDYSDHTDYRPPAGWYTRMNRLLGVPLTSLGLAPHGAATLQVRGRNSGRLRRTPILVTSLGTDRYLVALAGRSHWVRNVRAADGHAWLRRGRRTPVTLEELPVPERAPILLAYLQRPDRDGTPRANATSATHYFGLDRDPDLSDLAAIADRYPVFRIHDAHHA
jgi:MFS family permease